MGAWTMLRARAVVVALGGALGACAAPPATKPAGPVTNPQVAARPYRVKAPAALDPQKSYPLVLVLHGYGGNGERVERYHRLDPLVDELGFFAAYPDGTEEAPNRHFWGGHRRFWNATDACCDFFDPSVDDVGYLDAVIDDMSAHYRVDPKRIFVMGTSNGGFMAYRYACDRAGRVAAIVSHAGAMWLDPVRCQPSEPVAVLEIHGTNDEKVPYEGRAQPGPDASPVPSAHQSVADWVAFDRCSPTPDSSSPPLDLLENEGFDSPAAETTVEQWTGCRGVELWTMHGARHLPLPNQPNWAKSIYNWLAAHPKP